MKRISKTSFLHAIWSLRNSVASFVTRHQLFLLKWLLTRNSNINSKSLLPKYVGWLTIYNNRILIHASSLDFITHFFFRFVTFCSNFISNKHENHNRKWVDCEHYWLMALVVFCLITFIFFVDLYLNLMNSRINMIDYQFWLMMSWVLIR